MPHGEQGIFVSKHSTVPAPSYDRSERVDLPQTLVLAALAREVELDALVGGDLDSAKTLFTLFADEGHASGGGIGIGGIGIGGIGGGGGLADSLRLSSSGGLGLGLGHGGHRGHHAGAGLGGGGGQFDHLAPELIRSYWKDPESLPRMCVQRIDQEIDAQRTSKKLRVRACVVRACVVCARVCMRARVRRRAVAALKKKKKKK